MMMDDGSSGRRHCKYGAECWRPGCWFQHGDPETRLAFAEMYAGFWAEFGKGPGAQKPQGPRVNGMGTGAGPEACCGQCVNVGQVVSGFAAQLGKLEELVLSLVEAGQRGQPAGSERHGQRFSSDGGDRVLSLDQTTPGQLPPGGVEPLAAGLCDDGSDDDVQPQHQGEQLPNGDGQGRMRSQEQVADHGARQSARRQRGKRPTAQLARIKQCQEQRGEQG